MTYSANPRGRVHLSPYKPYKPRWTQRIGSIVGKALAYAVMIWYVAEITGNGQELRLAMRKGLSWCVYGAQYSIWVARQKEIL